MAFQARPTSPVGVQPGSGIGGGTLGSCSEVHPSIPFPATNPVMGHAGQYPCLPLSSWLHLASQQALPAPTDLSRARSDLCAPVSCTPKGLDAAGVIAQAGEWECCSPFGRVGGGGYRPVSANLGPQGLDT
ncbi:hypothetical protein DSO57_1032409 [Entomophthora muscae]|uniref:Uncharacterized protein n=1 Tax=Entomophthora muscae TaxID=34485 RepID=A0ACC2T0L2_9FUNG|nr:hypothetical protein DSO57_1032409 [Entomophthora muscae]